MMFPELAFRAIGHCLFGQLRLFIAFSPDGSRTDGLQLSLKLYHVRELWPGYQQSMTEAPEIGKQSANVGEKRRGREDAKLLIILVELARIELATS